MNTPPISLYIHIPFCAKKCPYCDFNTYARIEHLFSPYINALKLEIKQWGQLLGHPPVKTVFLGGGTPSYLPVKLIFSIIDTVFHAFDVDTKAEITLESNPRDFTPQHAKHLSASSINRLSFGAQSLNDDILSILGRDHDRATLIKAYENATAAGFKNINLDLIYGVPDLTAEIWEQTLNEAIALNPQHFSLYCLTLEKETPMYLALEKGELPRPDEDLAADQYIHAEATLANKDYIQYELSNWSKKDYSCTHNLQYWNNLPYLGFGPGAHSFYSNTRFSNLKSPTQYIKLIHQWILESNDKQFLHHLKSNPLIADFEVIPKNISMAEYMFLKLRLNKGITNDEFHSIYRDRFTNVFAKELPSLFDENLIFWNKNNLCLTKKGRLLANEVFTSFIGSYLQDTSN